jgi:hypothetical protein
MQMQMLLIKIWIWVERAPHCTALDRAALPIRTGSGGNRKGTARQGEAFLELPCPVFIRPGQPEPEPEPEPEPVHFHSDSASRDYRSAYSLQSHHLYGVPDRNTPCFGDLGLSGPPG